MKKISISILAFALLGLLPCFCMSSQGESSSAVVKIGYVDFSRALNSVSEGRSAKARLEDEFREKQQQLDRMQKELESTREGIEKDRLLVSDDELKTKEEKYRNKFFELQQLLSAFRKEMESREASLTQKILDKLKGIVNRIGSEEGYAMILEKSQDIVLYSPNMNDLTDQVIRLYDSSQGRKKGGQ